MNNRDVDYRYIKFLIFYNFDIIYIIFNDIFIILLFYDNVF